jgi:DNA-binding CsgD family transcriptional regulator
MTEVKTRHEKELRLLKDKSEKEIEDEQKKYAKDLETERLSFQKKQDSLRQELQKREARIDVLEKALIQRRKNAEIRREAFLNEPICRQILDLVHEKTFTTRDNSYDIGIALKDKDFTQLKRAVELHYEGFDNVLLGQCPDLNRDLLILCHLHLLGLDEKQIAALRNLTYGAILKQNERFMEKLGVNDDVGEFVLKVAEGLCGPENDPQDVPQGVAQGVAQGSSNEATQANLLILLDIVSNNPEITREEMAKQLGVSKKTIERYLKKLGNRVRYVGSGYSGHWEVD